MRKIFCVIAAAVLILNMGTVCFGVTVPAADDNISADAYVLIEAKSGRVIAGDNENTPLPMASTTKIMSVLLTLESGDLDSRFTVDPIAVHTEGSSMGLCEGDNVSKRDLCIGMLLPSGNDAANCAAVRVAGNIPDFVALMNRRASELGLTSTHFVTPSGLHDDDHYSTACDMARLAAYALTNPDFAAICRESSIRLSFGNPPYSRSLINTNKLLNMYQDCIGVKTGFTDEAGRCLVSAAERNGVRLICVTLHAPDDWNDHIKLLDYGFSVTSSVEYTEGCQYVTGLVGSSSDTIALVPERTPVYTSIKGAEQSITRKITVSPFVYAPVEAGQAIGTLTVYDNGTEVDRVCLIAACSYPLCGTPAPQRKSITERLIEKIKNYILQKK